MKLSKCCNNEMITFTDGVTWVCTRCNKTCEGAIRVTNKRINENDLIKVFLPGESCWARVFKKISNNIVIARIENNIGYGNHPYKNGDLVTFQFRDCPQVPEIYNWYLSPPWEQIDTNLKKVNTIEMLIEERKEQAE